MEAPRHDQLLGHGLYPLAQAARLVGVECRTVRRWLKGYSWRYRDGRSSSGPLWKLRYSNDEELGSEQVLSFHDLLELRCVAEFAKHGVSLAVIRATIEAAQVRFGDYPLHSKRFLTDGKRIFLEAVERLSDDPKLIDVRRGQFVFDAVIRPSLFAGIEYDHSQALRWFPVPKRTVIVLDPQVQFGEPIVAGTGVPTDALAAAFRAEGDNAQRVARLYRVKPEAVRAAVAFERQLASA